MSVFDAIRPKEPLRYLRWFDMLIVATILFGQFAYRSTQMYLATLMPQVQTAAEEVARDTSVSGVAYSDNFNHQVVLLAIALVYLWLRRFDFKQIPIKLNAMALVWTAVVFTLMGLISDAVTHLSGGYEYFHPELLKYVVTHLAPWNIFYEHFAVLSGMGIAYGFLNGFYEEFFFLGLLATCVPEQPKWKVWAVLAFSTLVRISFHTYQGMLWALVIGVVFGLLYYCFYKYKVKNLLPFILVHAMADMFGSGVIRLIVDWSAYS